MRGAPTDAEGRLWFCLRDGRLAGLKFRRQVALGDAIVDFACFEYRLVVEVDGGQHAGSLADQRRDEELAKVGIPSRSFLEP
jgi:very-short-patch-repair endonuclease